MRLEQFRESEQTLLFQLANIRRSYESMRGNIGFRDRIMQALMSGKITRVAATLSAAHRCGYGVRRLTAFLEDAIRANRVRYS